MKNLLMSFSVVSILSLASCGGEKDPAPVDCTVSDLALALQSSNGTSDCSSNDGSITVSGTGGVPPYQFQINSSEFQSTGEFTDLGPGDYIIVVKDDAGCTAEESITVEGATFTITMEKLSDAGCSSANGSFSVHGNLENLQYKLNDGAFQSSNTFTALVAGDYSVTVMDDSGCETTSTYKVLNGTSYANDVKEIITINCVNPGCHDGSRSIPDWSVFSNVQASAEKIKTRTQNKSMPQGGTLTQEQIDLIACWVDDGALDN